MFGCRLLPCFCRRRWPCWGCRPCVNSWKNWKNNANSVGQKWRWTRDLDEMWNSEWLGFWFQFTSTDLNTLNTFNDFSVKRTWCVKDSKLCLQCCRTSKHKLKFSTKMLSCERCGFQDVPVWEINEIGDTKSSTTQRGEGLQSITNEDVNFQSD